MSNIPYSFETPIPTDFRRDGWFKCDNTLKFVTWAFSRCSTREREVLHDHKKIILKPFQFIFGRFICSNETNMSEDEVRSQVTLLTKHNFLRKAPNKTPNRFTILEWVTTSFSQINPQQKHQQIPNKSPTNPHNLEGSIPSSEGILLESRSTETTTPTPPKEKAVVVVDKKALEMAKHSKKIGMPFSEADIIACVKEFSPYAVQEALLFFSKQNPYEWKAMKYPHKVLRKEAEKIFDYQQTLKELG